MYRRLLTGLAMVNPLLQSMRNSPRTKSALTQTRALWQGIKVDGIETLKLLKNPRVMFDSHEDIGRRNTTYLCLSIYACLFLLARWGIKRRAKKIEEAKVRMKPEIVERALSRAGLDPSRR